MDAKPIPSEQEDELDIFDRPDEAAEEAADREAEEDLAAGRVVAHEDVMKWVAKWGTPDEEPMPAEWLR